MDPPLPKAVIVVLPLQILITKNSLDEKLNKTFRQYIRMRLAAIEQALQTYMPTVMPNVLERV